MGKGRTEAVVGYVRTSSASNLNGNWEERQQATITTYAAQNGQHVVEWFKDPAVSGERSIEDRPGFLAMLEYMEANGIFAVVVESMDRFIRSTRVYHEATEELSKRGLEVVYAEDVTDLRNMGVSDDLIHKILAERAEKEKRRLVERLHEGREVKRETRGGRHVGRLKLGEKKPLLKEQVVRMRDAGMSLSQIAAALAAQGKTTSKGKPYAKTQIARVLAE